MKIDGNIIAHRGVHNNITIPENSLKAFKKAIELKYPIELDVQLTKDNKLVVFHDETLKRLTNKEGIIQKMNYDEFKDITLLNSKEIIPTLEEVLKLVDNQVLIDIEIKKTKRIKKTCTELIKQLNGFDNFIIKSFDFRIVRYLKKYNPNLEVGLLLTALKKHNKLVNNFFTRKFILKYLKVDFLALSKKLLEVKDFQKIIDSVPTLVWTITNKEEIDNTSNLIYICDNLPF